MIDKRFIGKQYPPSIYEVGREKIREYARAVGDENPLYLDADSGKQSKYGDMIAPPLFACVCLMPVFNAFTQDKEIFDDNCKGVHGAQSFKFFEVIRPGDILRTQGKIVDIYCRKYMDFINIEMVITNQRGSNVAVGQSTIVLWREAK